jgi:hypothetical protein
VTPKTYKIIDYLPSPATFLGFFSGGLILSILFMAGTTLEKRMAQPIQDMASQIGDLIQKEILERHKNLTFFKEMTPLKNSAQWGMGGPVPQTMDDAIKSYGVYKLFLLLDTNGLVQSVNKVDEKGEVLETHFLYGKSLADSDLFKKILNPGLSQEEKNPVFFEEPKNNPLINSIYKIPHSLILTMGSKVSDEGGKPIGVWTSFLDLSFVNKILSQFYKRIQEFKDSEIIILNPQGEILSYCTPLGCNFSPSRLNLLNLGSEAATRSLHGETGLLTEVHHKYRTPYVSGFSHTKEMKEKIGFGLSVIVRAPTSEVYAVILNIYKKSLFSLFLCLFLALLWGVRQRSSTTFSPHASPLRKEKAKAQENKIFLLLQEKQKELTQLLTLSQKIKEEIETPLHTVSTCIQSAMTALEKISSPSLEALHRSFEDLSSLSQPIPPKHTLETFKSYPDSFLEENIPSPPQVPFEKEKRKVSPSSLGEETKNTPHLLTSQLEKTEEYSHKLKEMISQIEEEVESMREGLLTIISRAGERK